MTLPNLINHADSTDMTALKKWREIRSNSRDSLLARSQNKSADINCTAGGTIVLTSDQQEENQLLRLTGSPGGGYTLEFADADKQMTIHNTSGQSATIETNTGASSPPIIADTETAILQIRGADITVNGTIGLQTGALLHSGQVDPTAGIDFADRKIENVCLIDYAFEVTSPSISSGTLTLNMENGNYFDVTLTEDLTDLVFSNPAVSSFNLQLEDGSGSLLLEDGSGFLIHEGSDAVANIVFIATQNGGGGHVITWPSFVKWEQGTGGSPDQTLTAGAIDIYFFFSVGSDEVSLLQEDGSGGILLEDGSGKLLLESSGDEVWYGVVLGLDMG